MGCSCIVHQTFYGKLQSTIECLSPGCKDVNTSIESFLDLSLGLETFSKKKNLKGTPLSLQKCLDEEYKNWENCDYNCRKCDSRDARKQLSIKSLPNVLCIQLKVSLLSSSKHYSRRGAFSRIGYSFTSGPWHLEGERRE